MTEMATSKLAAAAATKVQSAAQKVAGGKTAPAGDPRPLDDGQPVKGTANRAGVPVKEPTDKQHKASGVVAPIKPAVAQKTTALATRDPKAGAVAVASEAIDFESDAGMGMEGADKDSFALPFLTVLQGLSPQLESVDGAKPGLIINTVTNELYSELLFVPVAFQRRFNRWIPRSQGGGFKGTMTVAEVEQLQASGKATEEVQVVDGKESTVLMYEDTQLKDTRNHFVLMLDEDGGWHPALISLASTQIKRSKRLMAMIQNYVKSGANGRKFNPPSFASVYRATTESETNNKGTYKAWVFERVEDVTDAALYQAAKEFHAQVTSGAVVVAPPPEAGDEEGAEGNGRF